ncbi:hypothetical protein D3C72_2063810 [compost metagenome]
MVGVILPGLLGVQLNGLLAITSQPAAGGEKPGANTCSTSQAGTPATSGPLHCASGVAEKFRLLSSGRLGR